MADTVRASIYTRSIMRLSAIHVFPLKSGAARALPTAQVEPLGLADDRRFMVVDAAGRFITGRQVPRLVLIAATPLCGGGLRLEFPGLEPLEVRTPSADAPRRTVGIWDDRVDAAEVPAAEAWLTRALGRPAQLVHFDALAQRSVDATYARAGDVVGFADGFPLLLIAQASLDALNAKLAQPIPMLRFRPNLVVDGATPHAEDLWKRVRIGAVELEVVKPCTRCVFTTVDPARGALDPSGEPLATLKTYRRTPKGVTFGQNLIARGTGSIALGDAVEVLE